VRFKLVCLVAGFICGYILITWIPDERPLNMIDFITFILVNPLSSFLAMSCFLVGFIANAILIREVIEGTYLLLTNSGVRIDELLISYGVLLSFYLLFELNTLVTGLYFIFALIYCLISLDFKKDRNYKNNI